MKKTIFLMCALLASTAAVAVGKSVDVAAVYYSYPTNRIPSLGGFIKCDNPVHVEKEIAVAANAGIDIFLYNVPSGEGFEMINRSLGGGFLKAKNRDKMKFALLWTYGPGCRNTFSSFVNDAAEKYFGNPGYWKKDGKIFLSVGNVTNYVKEVGVDAVRKALAEARERVKKAGLGDLHINARNMRTEDVIKIKALGFDSVTDYEVVANVRPKFNVKFREHLRAAIKKSEKDGAIYIDGWNNFKKGVWLIPERDYKDEFLSIIAGEFGRNPADKYVFFDEMIRQVFSIPIQTYSNLAYDNKNVKQRVDVWLPKNVKGKTPVIVYIHGGGWYSGVRVDRIIGLMVQKILDEGIAVVAVGYRFVNQERGVKPPVMTPLRDAEKGLKYVMDHADEWNIDLSRMALSGASAGSVTAMWLALKDNNPYNIRALAPIIPQTSMDPKEMKEWIPNSPYGGHAFGYRNFNEWLEHRDECLEDIEKVSPSALVRRIDPAKAPEIFILCSKPMPPGKLTNDPVHAGAFGVEFKKICDARGIRCELNHDRSRYFAAGLESLIKFFKR